MDKFKSVNGYEPTKLEPFMNDEMAAYFREKLLYMKQQLIAKELSNYELKEDLSGSNEADPSDRATREEEASLSLKQNERLGKELMAVNNALSRIERGEYGYCLETGREIDLDRLKIKPTAIYCVDVVKEKEKANGNKAI
jgi:DnaK suppressor protein